MPERARARHLAPPAPSPFTDLTAPLCAAAGRMARISSVALRADLRPVRLAGIAAVASSGLLTSLALPTTALAATPGPGQSQASGTAASGASDQRTAPHRDGPPTGALRRGRILAPEPRVPRRPAGRTTADAADVAVPHHTSAALAVASRYLGTPYRWGGTTPRGFDCSGFTQYVYRQLGKDLPRTVAGQRAATRPIHRTKARAGDLVFFGNGHLGIYAGANLMIDAPRSGRSVTLREIYSAHVQFGRV